MKVAIVVFPGSNCDTDMYHAGGMMEKENHNRISVYIHSRP